MCWRGLLLVSAASLRGLLWKIWSQTPFINSLFIFESSSFEIDSFFLLFPERQIYLMKVRERCLCGEMSRGAPIRAISVDALGTVVQVRGGSVGHQYAIAARRFLRRIVALAAKQQTGDAACAAITVCNKANDALLNQVLAPSDLDDKFRKSFKHFAKQFVRVRPRCQPSDEQFWTEHVLAATFREPLGALEEAVSLASNNRWRLRDDERLQLYREVYRHFGTAEAWELLPGAAEALNNIALRDIELCCVTNNDGRMSAVLKQLASSEALQTGELAGVRKIADCVVCSFDVAEVKPDPQGIRLAASRLGIPLSNWLHVGDEDADEQAAALAPCRFVRVPPSRGIYWSDVQPHI